MPRAKSKPGPESDLPALLEALDNRQHFTDADRARYLRALVEELMPCISSEIQAKVSASCAAENVRHQAGISKFEYGRTKVTVDYRIPKECAAAARMERRGGVHALVVEALTSVWSEYVPGGTDVYGTCLYNFRVSN